MSSPLTVGVAVFWGAYWIAAGLADPIVVKTATTAAKPSVAKTAPSIRDLRVGLCIKRLPSRVCV